MAQIGRHIDDLGLKRASSFAADSDRAISEPYKRSRKEERSFRCVVLAALEAVQGPLQQECCKRSGRFENLSSLSRHVHAKLHRKSEVHRPISISRCDECTFYYLNTLIDDHNCEARREDRSFKNQLEIWEALYRQLVEFFVHHGLNAAANCAAGSAVTAAACATDQAQLQSTAKDDTTMAGPEFTPPTTGLPLENPAILTPPEDAAPRQDHSLNNDVPQPSGMEPTPSPLQNSTDLEEIITAMLTEITRLTTKYSQMLENFDPDVAPLRELVTCLVICRYSVCRGDEDFAPMPSQADGAAQSPSIALSQNTILQALRWGIQDLVSRYSLVRSFKTDVTVLQGHAERLYICSHSLCGIGLDFDTFLNEPANAGKAQSSDASGFGICGPQLPTNSQTATPHLTTDPGCLGDHAEDSTYRSRTYQACIPSHHRKVRCDLGSVDNLHDPPCVRCRGERREFLFSSTRHKQRKDDGGDDEGVLMEDVIDPRPDESATERIVSRAVEKWCSVRNRCLQSRQKQRGENDAIYVCTSGCGKRFARPDQFERHEEINMPQSLYCCLACIADGQEEPYVHQRTDKMRAHLKSRHLSVNINEVLYDSFRHVPWTDLGRCGFCGHRFLDWKQRTQHICGHFDEGRRVEEWEHPWLDEVEPAMQNEVSDHENDRRDEAATNSESSIDDNATSTKRLLHVDPYLLDSTGSACG